MKRGFTLIELLVYMMIMGFIIVVAGRVFSDSTSMRIRTQSMAASMEEINKITALLKEDLSQMGAKEYRDGAASLGTEEIFTIVNEAYMLTKPGDSSSFSLVHLSSIRDSIAFKKIAVDANGKYLGVRLISWVLAEDSTLRRRCVTLNIPPGIDPNDDPEIAVCRSGNNLGTVEPIVMATDIMAFTFLPSKPGAKTPNNSPLFGKKEFSLANRADNRDGEVSPASVNDKTIKGFELNDTKDGQRRHEITIVEENDASGSCREYPFRKGDTYFVTFKTPLDADTLYMPTFQPGIDHASVGFRAKNKLSDPKPPEGLPNDFLFYIPQTKLDKEEKLRVDTMSHYFEFSVKSEDDKKDINACVMFTLAFYSPMAYNGTMKIEDFQVDKKDDGAYHFVRDNDPEYDKDYATESDQQSSENKKKVKAFELFLKIDKRGEISSTRPEAGSSGYVIATPNNGLRPHQRPSQSP